MNEVSKAVHCAAVYISFVLLFFQQWTNHLKKKKVSCIWLWIMPLPGTLMNMTMQKHIFFFKEKTCLLMLLWQHYSELTFSECWKCWVFAEYGELIYLWMDMGACGWPQIFITVAGTPVSFFFPRKNFHELHGVPNSYIVSLYSISSLTCCVKVSKWDCYLSRF